MRQRPARRLPAARAAAAAAVGTLLALSVTPAVAAPASGADDPGAVHGVAMPADKHLDARTTKPFSMVGLTWNNPRAHVEETVQVRTRDSATGTWRAWTNLDFDSESPRGKGVRGGSQPLWAGPSDGVEARVVGADGSSSALPAGARIDLVDPGSVPAGTKDRAARTTTSAALAAPSDSAGAVAAAEAAQPPIVSRAGWGADESLVEDPPTYDAETKAVFVHHSAGTNDYTCAESASIVRGIFLYHVQSNGWNDVGYNFLVDKCGTIFEGRGGGVNKPVHAAHTYGFNTDTSSVSVLGNFNTATVPAAVTDSVARIAAWKLGLYGYDPESRVTLTALESNGKYTKGQQVVMDRISGHRDGYPTECPGANLYDKLPAIRTLAGTYAAGPERGDYNGDGRADLAVGVPETTVGGKAGAGSVGVLPGAAGGPDRTAKVLISQGVDGVPGGSEPGDGLGTDIAYGNLNGDRYADLAVSAPGEEDGSGQSDQGAVTVLYGGADGFTAEPAMGMAPSADRASGARLGQALTAGDFDGDGRDELAAFAPGTGVVAVSDALGFPTLTDLSDGAVSAPDMAAGDFDSDGYTDLAVTYRAADGSTPLTVIPGSADGLAPDAARTVTGGSSLATGDIDGDGRTDLVVGQPDAVTGGRITAYSGSADGLNATGVSLDQNSASVPGGSESGDDLGASVSTGDVDGDGYADILAGLPGEDLTVSGTAHADAGTVLVFRGSAAGLTGAGSATYNASATGFGGAAETGDRLGTAASLADFDGDGHADLGIGSDGENAGEGTVVSLLSPGGVPATTSSAYYGPGTFGLTATHFGGVLAP
ncbi:FG-GAP-like repeat-containing protein [Streptomyces coelicoflavus]|uniref:FG-GAP-like repeat-containing protein n=1 Tax=Streptomyces coelicoflavus TaxID=285562 RepID=UPI0036A36DC5